MEQTNSIHRRDKAARLDFKRAIDFILSGALLFVACPIFLAAAAAIYAADGGPIFYRQSRAGLYGRPFGLLKFRSMRVNDISPIALGQMRNEHPMVTPTGRWIRRFKIDELPQLWNVLRGDMALVGPRPRTVEQLAGDGELERRRLVLRPGMTGWAQVNGNTEISWRDRFLLDAWYVDHQSAWLDFTILLMTIRVVAFGETSNRQAVEKAMEYADCIGRRG